MLEPTGPTADESPRCSAKGCRKRAVWTLRWRNPRLHDAARVKTWLACDEHRTQLADFLAARRFLLGTDPLDVAPDAGDAPTQRPDLS